MDTLRSCLIYVFPKKVPILFIALAIVLLLRVGSPVVYALGQQSTASITVMQKDPNTAGDSAVITVQVTDPDDTFSYEKCMCSVTVTKNAKVVFYDPLGYTTGKSMHITYTFPTLGTYTIMFTATPQAGATFTKITTQKNYTITKQVTLIQQAKENGQTYEKAGVSTIVILIFLVFFLFIISYPVLKKNHVIK